MRKSRPHIGGGIFLREHICFWFVYGLGYGYGMVTVIGGFSVDFPCDLPSDDP